MIFDHLGVVVPFLSDGRRHLLGLLNVDRWTEEFEDPVNNVWVQFGADRSGTCYELIAPRNDQSPVAQALRRGAPILNHVAYLVRSLDVEVSRLREHGCVPAGGAKPAIAYGGRPIQFLMSPMRFMLELIEAPDHRHAYGSNL